MSHAAAEASGICPLTGNASREYARKGDAVYLRDPESGIIFLAERPRLEDMAAFVDAEYEAGVYRDYVNARELKLATMRRRLPVIRAHARGVAAARCRLRRRASSSRLRSRRVSIRRASSCRR